MFYIVWIVTALVAVALGIWTVGKMDKRDEKDKVGLLLSLCVNFQICHLSMTWFSVCKIEVRI